MPIGLFLSVFNAHNDVVTLCSSLLLASPGSPAHLNYCAYLDIMNGQDLLKYTLSNTGILHCFLRDLWTLKRKRESIDGIFWLNEVPCASIKFVGIVVGTKLYDKNTCIWVDDGSAVVEARLAHKLVTLVVETKGEDGRSSIKSEVQSMEPPYEVPQIGATVNVLAKLEGPSWQDQDQPVNVRIKDIVVCGNMEEAHHWDRVIQLHKTKYSQPFLPPDLSTFIEPTSSAASTPCKPSTPHKTPQTPIQATPRATHSRSAPASSISLESVRPCTAPQMNYPTTSGLMPRLRHPSRLKSSQLNLETLKMYIIYYMTCMARHFGESRPGDDLTPTKRRPLRPSQRHSQFSNSSDHENDIDAEEPTGFGQGYLMKVPELQNLALRVIKAERKLAEKRKILQELENRNNSLMPGDGSSRPNKQTKPGNLKKDLRRLFDRVISDLFHNGAIVIEEGRSRRWDDDEALLVDLLRLWKHKTDETQTQYEESNLGTISEVSIASTMPEDELHLSDVDDTEDCYTPVTPRLLREPVLLAISRATYRRKREHVDGKFKPQGASEPDILKQLKGMDSRWDHISSLAATLEELEQDDEIWEASRGVWAAHEH